MLSSVWRRLHSGAPCERVWVFVCILSPALCQLGSILTVSCLLLVSSRTWSTPQPSWVSGSVFPTLERINRIWTLGCPHDYPLSCPCLMKLLSLDIPASPALWVLSCAIPLPALPGCPPLDKVLCIFFWLWQMGIPSCGLFITPVACGCLTTKQFS